MLPLKTRIGGLSTLQAAICYDTLGNAQQAQALYKRLRGHPNSEVGRKARHLVFGFQVGGGWRVGWVGRQAGGCAGGLGRWVGGWAGGCYEDQVLELT